MEGVSYIDFGAGFHNVKSIINSILKALNFVKQVYGGGYFECDAILKWFADNLFAIYPGGHINLDHAGYKPVTVTTYDDDIGDIQGNFQFW